MVEGCAALCDPVESETGPPKVAAAGQGTFVSTRLRHDNVCPELISKLRACLVKCLAEPLARPVTPEECIVAIAGKRQLARLPGLVVAYAAFLHVARAGLGINDSHAGQDRLPSRLLQECDLLSTLQAAVISERMTSPAEDARLASGCWPLYQAGLTIRRAPTKVSEMLPTSLSPFPSFLAQSASPFLLSS
jgi:hypothetical protein